MIAQAFLSMHTTITIQAASFRDQDVMRFPATLLTVNVLYVQRLQCCNFVQAIEVARRFNETWDTDIQLLRHDCHHHTAQLVQRLTGDQIDVGSLFPLQQKTIWL